jgi:ethanolamine utilization microcompartment shell protein EutL
MAEVAGMNVDAEGIEHEMQLAEQERLIELLTAERDELLDQLSAIGTAVKRASVAK